MSNSNQWGNYSPEIISRIDGLVATADSIPGVVVLHEVGDYPVVYMCTKGLVQLGITLPELQQMKAEYHSRYFNIDDMGDFLPKLHHLIQQKDPDAHFAYFQQVKLASSDSWVWYLTCTRIFALDEKRNPLIIISVALPVQDMKHIPKKAERLQKENYFLKQNFHRFAKLGDREREVLKLVSLSIGSAEIAEKLFISVEAVHTHRKISRKN